MASVVTNVAIAVIIIAHASILHVVAASMTAKKSFLEFGCSKGRETASNQFAGLE